MDPQYFTRLVAEDVKNKISAEQAEFLRLPENWTAWKKELLDLLNNLWQQLDTIDEQEKKDAKRYADLGESGKRLILESTMAAQERRKKITRFKFYVEQRVAEVDRMIAFGEENPGAELSPVGFLQQAIKTHRRLMLEEMDLEPTPVDEALWAALDGKWNFDAIEQEQQEEEEEWA